MNSDNNTCAICLELLSSAPIGVVGPCGHVFHVECWQEWAKSSRSRSGMPKCVMCNLPSKDFFRLYLDIGKLANNEGEHEADDSSLSSSSEAEGETKNQENVENAVNGHEEVDDADERNHRRSETSIVRGANQIEVIVIDDDAVETSQNSMRNSKRTNSISQTTDEKKLRKRAKRYKQLYRIIQSQQTQESENLKSLHEMLSKIRKELEAKDQYCESIVNELNSIRRDCEGTKLDLVQLQRKYTSTRNECSQLSLREKALREQMDVIQETHKRQLEQAKGKNLAEVKLIMDQNPKLKKENYMLKEMARRQKSEIDELKRLVSSHTVDRVVSKELHRNVGHNQTGCKKSTKTLLQAIGKDVGNKVLDSKPRTNDAELQLCLQKSSRSAMQATQGQSEVKTVHMSPFDILNSNLPTGKIQARSQTTRAQLNIKTTRSAQCDTQKLIYSWSKSGINGKP